MNLVPFLPRKSGHYGDLISLPDSLDRLFTETWKGFLGRDFFPERGYYPAVDLYETDQDIVVKAELPGMDKKDLKVNLSDGLLTIQGEKKKENEVKKKNYRRLESSYGAFQRTVEIPVAVQAEKAKADYKQGVLEVTLPKAEEAKVREININVN